MFARFDENPAMTLQDIKETKRYGRTDAHTDGQRENSIPTTKFAGDIMKTVYPPQTKFAGGININQRSYYYYYSYPKFSILRLTFYGKPASKS